jgi:flagellin
MNLTSSLEKLSSGLKINKAADDAAGMAIADKLRTQASSLGQGISNANSGTALIQIADKAMAEQSNILDIVKTKLIQASTSTTSEEGREAVRKDIAKLLAQLDNISEQTNYNGINLLNEKGAGFSFQVGEDSSFDIGLQTAYAVNTKGLGSTGEVSDDAEALVNFGKSGTLQISGDNTAITVQNVSTVVGDKKAITINGDSILSKADTTQSSESSIMVSGDNVQSISAHVAKGTLGGNITIETTDQETIAALNAAAGSDYNLKRLEDGTYQITVGSAANAATAFVQIDFGIGGIDLNNVKFSGLTIGTIAGQTDVLVIETDDALTVEKLSGAESVSIDGSVIADQAADTLNNGTNTINNNLVGSNIKNASGLSFGGQNVGTAADNMVIELGTLTVKGDISKSTLANQTAVVGINTQTVNSFSANEDATFTVSAKEVSSIVFTSSNATSKASVIMMTSDADTQAVLEQMANNDKNLTSLGDGSFKLEQTTAAAKAILDFGEDSKVDLSSLKFANVTTSSLATAAAITDRIYIETDNAVSVTKNGTKDGSTDISVAGVSMGTKGTLSNANMVGVQTEDSLTSSESLNTLKELGENELTSDIANKFMSIIDDAMTQLNSVRSDFGSTQGQLEVATRNMMVTKVNIQAAESVIRDVDYAAESANFNKQNIIAQAGTYAMSQANAMQQNVLRLLQ